MLLEKLEDARLDVLDFLDACELREILEAALETTDPGEIRFLLSGPSASSEELELSSDSGTKDLLDLELASSSSSLSSLYVSPVSRFTS